MWASRHVRVHAFPLPRQLITGRKESTMRSLIAGAAIAMLAFAGCSTSEPAPESAPVPGITADAPVKPTEIPITIGEPFTIESSDYTTQVTIKQVYVPEMCGDNPNQNPAIEADVEVISGNGVEEVLGTGAIRERTPDGYIRNDRAVSRSCAGIDELDAVNGQIGDKFRGLRWLKDDVDRQSEILINAPTGGGPTGEVFVLDLATADIDSAPTSLAPPSAATPSEAEEGPAPSPVAPEPYVVECLFGTPGPSRMSDGTIRSTDYCANQPGAAEQRSLEGNCSDVTWRQEMGLEGDRVCGSSLFEEGNLPGQ